jgi:CheY-like chemotaxis protein
LQNIARGLGVHCDAVSSGEEALRCIESNPAYSMCFVDCSLIGIDAVELTRQILTHPEKASKVVMISGCDLRRVEQRMAMAGIDQVIAKPLFASSVAECLNKNLASTQASPHGQIDRVVSYIGHHMLLVEDIEINREIVLAILEPTLMIVDCAENGAKAVSMFEKNPERYDIILMDILMPVMDGYEATKQIRALATHQAKTVPIVAMTANVYREDIEKSYAVGMNGHLAKPFDTADVFQILEEHLPESRHRSEN